MKNIAGLPGIQNIKTLSSGGQKSIPRTQKSAFLELYMRQNAKERLLMEGNKLREEKEKLQQKKRRINQNLAEIDKRMAALLRVATQPRKIAKGANPGSKNHTVLEY